MGSHIDIDPQTKDFIQRLRTNNVTLGRVCSIIGVSSADKRLLIRKQAVRNLCARIVQEDIRDDVQKTMELLNRMAKEDKDMKIMFQKDEDGRITNMLWCTGKNQLDYKHFGDVVTFDTTYRTNLYNLPFGIFVGVNNHYQSIIFGGVLLSHERTEDFEWTFKNFLDIMERKHPQTILTGTKSGNCLVLVNPVGSTPNLTFSILFRSVSGSGSRNKDNTTRNKASLVQVACAEESKTKNWSTIFQEKCFQEKVQQTHN